MAYKFIDENALQNIRNAQKYIQTSPDLDLQDMPTLANECEEFKSAIIGRTAAFKPDQRNQGSTDKQEVDAALSVEEDTAMNSVNDVNGGSEMAMAKSKEAVSSKTADMTEKRRKTAKNFFTEKEAAEYLKVNRISLKRWRLAGKGPRYVRLGPRQVRYEDIDLNNFTDQLKKGGLDAKTA